MGLNPGREKIYYTPTGVIMVAAIVVTVTTVPADWGIWIRYAFIICSGKSSTIYLSAKPIGHLSP